MTFPGLFVAAALSAVLVFVWLKLRLALRADYIRSHQFPAGLFGKLRIKYPDLTQKDCQLIARALRHYFLAHLKSGCKFVSMPSQVADELWHEFILYTKEYARFCNKAFGHFMHHTPAVVLSSSKESNEGLRRCWWYVCREENINPAKATRLPLLFALDAKLKIPNGFRYSVDCGGMKANRGDASGDAAAVYCGGDFSSTGFDGTTDGFGDASSADGGGDGGGGGGGCGGD